MRIGELTRRTGVSERSLLDDVTPLIVCPCRYPGEQTERTGQQGEPGEQWLGSA
jgi:hypothetical protein